MRQAIEQHAHFRLRTVASMVALAALTMGSAQAADVIKIGSTTYFAYDPTLAAGTKVYMNIDSNPALTDIRATQRSLGYREVDYKSYFFDSLSYKAATISTDASGNTVYDYSASALTAKGKADKTNLVGYWMSKDLPIIAGPDGKAYITDGHHTTAGYLAASNYSSNSIQMIPGLGHVVLGTIQQNTYNAASVAAPNDAWWLARQSANNAYLYGTGGNQLAQPADAGYAGLQPILPSNVAMPTVPGKWSMTNDSYRSMTWGLADGITNKTIGYLKVNPASPTGADVNFVEFYWADFLRNRIVWDDTKSGSALGSGKSDANLISAPLAFFAAVANGAALAKSEAYKDQYNRGLLDYTASSFSANTQSWANASLTNGLAKAGETYHMYLLDDSTVQGNITPSALSTNKLHIDTTTGQKIDGKIQNVSSVDINKGSTITTSWKDASLAAQNSTLTIAAGTGRVVFTAANDYTGTTNVGAGTLEIAAGGAIGNGGVNVDAGAELVNNGGVGGAVLVNGRVSGGGRFDGLVSVAGGGHLRNADGAASFAGGLNLATGSILDFALGSGLSSLHVTGGSFSTGGNVIVNFDFAPGYTLSGPYTLLDCGGAAVCSFNAADFTLGNVSQSAYRFAVSGNSLTVVAVPEPETYAMLLAGLGLLGLAARRKRQSDALKAA